MNFSKLHTEANLYRKHPGDRLWQKVEIKLDSGKKHSSGFKLSYVLTIAALFIGIMVISFGLFPSKSSLTESTSLEFENVEISSQNHQIYSVEKVSSLKYAYSKLNLTNLSKYRGN